jgi:2-amino-4-hydroxy-6-hydroxymethyldihydropteridine diphosphokinase
MPDLAFVALGSNLGDRDAHLAHARRAIADLAGTRLLAASAVEETVPLGGLAQPPYLNQMVALETTLPPRALLAALHDIEAARGRQRAGRWESRTLDLDLVRFDAVECADADLRLPHPGLADRDFWQRELAAVERML